MSNDNTQDGAEPSLASAGSQPVAWAVEWKGDTKIDRSTVCYTEDDAKRKADECPALDGVAVALYRATQPTLTDEEREAIEYGALVCDATAGMANDRATIDGAGRAADVLRGLLERKE